MSDGGFSADAGQVLNPDGTVTYEFDGKVIARGVDLTAGTSPTPTADRRIRWIAPDGSELAAIFAFNSGAGAGGSLDLLTGDSGFLIDDQDGFTKQVKVLSDSAQATLLRPDGTSDFVLGQIVAGAAYTSYDSSDTSDTVSVAHAHGAAPTAVVASTGQDGHVAYANGDSSSLDFFTRTLDGAVVSGPVGVNYIAFFPNA